MPDRFSGYTVGPIVLIRPAKRDDVGLLKHELVHVKQFWRSFGLFGIAYWLSKKKRFEYEVEAYREQLKYSPGREQRFAWFLANNYNLDVTEQQALEALTRV
jgi:hypothetical protein